MSDWQADRIRYGSLAWLLHPSYWSVSVYRLGRWSLSCPRLLRRPAHALYFAAYSTVRIMTGIDIPRTARIGPGLLIHHFGGVMVNPQATIGARCTLRHGVTIGDRYGMNDIPMLGNDVSVGAYAQILGNVRVGDGASIGAMAVVLTDVPAGGTAVGNPARIIAAG